LGCFTHHARNVMGDVVYYLGYLQLYFQLFVFVIPVKYRRKGHFTPVRWFPPMNFGDVVDYVDLLRFLTWVLGKLHNQASSLDIFALTANLFSRLLQNRLHNFGRESEVFIHQFVEQRFYLLNQIPLFR